jgi:mono/diheme cytochrome c family protein
VKKQTYAGIALALIVVVMVYAIGSFLRENWGADQAPGAVEQFLARWLLSGARQSQADLPNPFPPDGPHLQEGRELYEKHCAFCHGLDGKGPGENGIQFYPPVPSLVGSEMELRDGQMHYIISRGIRYTAMPSFAKVLTPDQIWKVITWVRSLPRSAGTEITDPRAPSP